MPPILKVENLKVYFPRRAPLFHPGAPRIKAVDDVSFEIERNAVVGLIGDDVGRVPEWARPIPIADAV